MSLVEARKHPTEDKILITQTPGRIMLIDFPEARDLVLKLMELLAKHDHGPRPGVRP